MLKVVYIPTLTSGVCHWRIESYAQELLKFFPEASVHVNYMPGFKEKIAWDKICLGFGDTSKQIQEQLESCFQVFDVIIFQKIQYKEALALLEKYKEMYPETKIIAEIDDSVGHVGPSNPHFFQFADHHKWAAQHCIMSDGIITSTEYLAKSLAEFNDNIHVAPNCINTKIWEFLSPELPTGGPARIGYVGAGSHDEDLKIAYKAMLPLLDSGDFKFIIRYGGFRPKWLKKHKAIDFKRVAWTMDKYPQKLADLNLELALAPIRDTEFNRCKSNLKWIEWSSLGVPLLASRVEPYDKTVGSIYLTSNDVNDWTTFIKGLSPHLRTNPEAMRRILQRENRENYNINNETRKLIDWLKTVKVAEKADERITR
jgi:hypothetical protein